MFQKNVKIDLIFIKWNEFIIPKFYNNNYFIYLQII